VVTAHHVQLEVVGERDALCEPDVPELLDADDLNGAAVAAGDGGQLHLGLAAVVGAEDEKAAVEFPAADHLIIDKQGLVGAALAKREFALAPRRVTLQL